jgi:hypothetical protein
VLAKLRHRLALRAESPVHVAASPDVAAAAYGRELRSAARR